VYAVTSTCLIFYNDMFKSIVVRKISSICTVRSLVRDISGCYFLLFYCHRYDEAGLSHRREIAERFSLF